MVKNSNIRKTNYAMFEDVCVFREGIMKCATSDTVGSDRDCA